MEVSTPGLWPLRPFAGAGRRIQTNGWLTPDDRPYILDRLEALKTGYARLDFALPAGVIHGDASVGNVIHDDTGDSWAGQLKREAQLRICSAGESGSSVWRGRCSVSVDSV